LLTDSVTLQDGAGAMRAVALRRPDANSRSAFRARCCACFTEAMAGPIQQGCDGGVKNPVCGRGATAPNSTADSGIS